MNGILEIFFDLTVLELICIARGTRAAAVTDRKDAGIFYSTLQEADESLVDLRDVSARAWKLVVSSNPCC
jgi:hypothetical protein